MLLLAVIITPFINVKDNNAPEFSTAGFYEVNKEVREAINFNVGWRFYKGVSKNAESVEFNDKPWPVVCTPHGLELVPLIGSGGLNYQGGAWYRKHFEIPSDWKKKSYSSTSRPSWENRKFG